MDISLLLIATMALLGILIAVILPAVLLKRVDKLTTEITLYSKEILDDQKTKIDIEKGFRDSVIRKNSDDITILKGELASQKKEIDELWDWIHGEDWESEDWKKDS